MLEILHHSRSRSLVQGQVVASDVVDLAPAFAASGFKREINVGESLADLGVEVVRDPGGGVGRVSGGIPAACRREVRLVRWLTSERIRDGLTLA